MTDLTILNSVFCEQVPLSVWHLIFLNLKKLLGLLTQYLFLALQIRVKISIDKCASYTKLSILDIINPIFPMNNRGGINNFLLDLPLSFKGI